MPRIAILAYHRVHRDDDPGMPAVGPDGHSGHVTLSVFRRQMAALAERNFRTIHHEHIADWLYGRKDLPSGPLIALGFDDNRLNVLENAAPVMAEYGFTGTVWTISRLADGTLPDYETYPWMNWDHLGELVEKGWEIGAHTASHFMGPALFRGTHGPDGPRRYADELVECNREIEGHLGIRPKHFAYPGGEWNDEVESLVVRHYETARHWICDDLAYEPNTFLTNPYRLQAINVSMHMPQDAYLALLDDAVERIH